MDFKTRVKNKAYSVIKDSFPELMGKRIFFVTMKFRYFAMSFWVPPSLRIVIISKRTREFSDEVLTAIIAHELCHQVRYLEMGSLKYIPFAFKYLFSSKTQTLEERATDKLTIEKGYGRQLYQLTVISHNDHNHSDIIANYLSPGEIKEYAESLGKW